MGETLHDNTQLAPPAALVPAGGPAAPLILARLLALRLSTLQWAIGGFCALVGTLMLIVPHQFSSPSFALLRTVLPWAGTLYLLSGLAAVIAAAGPPRAPLTLLAHLACGGVLLFHSYLLMSTGTLTGWPPYLVLGLGMIGSAALTRRRGPAGSGDLLALLIGLCAVANGMVMLLVPDQFQLSIYDAVRPYLGLFGAIYLIGGPLVVLAQLRPGWPLALRWLCHALVAGPFLFYMALVSVPSGGITGMIFYGGSSLLLLCLPLLSGVSRDSEAVSLRVRLSLTLAAVSALPLVLVTAVITSSQEAAALQQVVVNQRVLAGALATQVGDYLLLHRRAVEVLAGEPGLLDLPPAGQRARLTALNAIYPEFYNCSTYRRDGWPFARSDGQPGHSGLGVGVFRRVLESGAPAVTVRYSQVINQPALAFGAPVLAPGGVVAGVVVCGLETTDLAAAIVRSRGLADRQIYLVEGRGRAVVHTDLTRVPPLTDLSKLPPVRALLAVSPSSGAMTYGQTPGAWVAGYAPVEGLGWGVVVERPIAVALASVHDDRELAFFVLLVVLGAGAAVGFAVSRYLTAPLSALELAAGRLARGDVSAPLPQHGAPEIVRLAQAFDQMRADMTSAAASREQAIQQREIFFSVAAHELKTPLTSLLGQAQLFKRRAARDGGISPRDQRSLDVIVAQAERLSALITDLLDITRIQQGQLTLALAPVDLSALVAQVVDETRPTIERHQLTLHGADRPTVISGDALRLEQVLQNLLSNAIKYSPQGGEVAVCVGREGGMAFVSVADEGIGIPAEAIPQLFQRFYRAGNADPRQISGLGLGLYVVREIVDRHGGRVEVRSAVGAGSAFTVWLPLTGGE